MMLETVTTCTLDWRVLIRRGIDEIEPAKLILATIPSY